MASDMCLVLALLLILVVLFKVKKKTASGDDACQLRLPPGPWQLPVIGNLHQLLMGGPLVYRTMTDLARVLDAPLMSLRIGEIPVVVASSADAAREILKTHDVRFATRPWTSTVRMMMANGTGLVFTPNDALWRQLRKVAMVELLGARRVQSFRRIREEEAGRLVAAVAAVQVQPGQAVNISERIAVHITDSVVRTIIGDRPFEMREEFLEALAEGIKISSGFGLGDLFPSSRLARLVGGSTRRVEAIVHKASDLMDCAIRQHEEQKAAAGGDVDDEDLIDVLLRIHKEGGLEVPITMGNVKVVIRELFGGGSETSTTVLLWAMTELARNPRVMLKAQAELRDAFHGKQTVTEDGLAGLNYLKMVIKETLRLHPLIPLLLPRECQETCEVMGYHVPKGTTVFVNVWAISRNPSSWDDAETFRPERFEDGALDFKGTHFEFTPFGAGRRMCPGMLFGQASMEITLASLLYHFDWELPHGVNKLDAAEKMGCTIRRKNDLYLVPTVRVPVPTAPRP